MSGPRPTAALLIAAAVSVAFLGWMAGRTPLAIGDSGDYFLTLEAFANHGTPDVRAEDAASFGSTAARNPIRGTFGDILQQARASRQGYAYTWHFWMYPLACLPAKLALRAVDVNELAAPQVTNALFLLGAAWLIALAPWLDRRMAVWWSVLSVVGPPAWFCVWPHTEVFTFALVSAGVAFAIGGRWVAATAAVAVASMQNAPLAPLAGALAVASVVRPPRTVERLVFALAAVLPALIPPLFYVATFGRPSIMLGESAAFESISLSKATDLLLDLNMGLLPYIPGVVLLSAAAIVILNGRDRLSTLACWTAFFVVALGASAGVVWNFGTSGPSRYAVWLSPFLIAAASLVAKKGGWGHAALALTLAAQAAVTITRLPEWAEDDHTSHSYAARFVLHRWPRLYSPHPHIFLDRTPALYEGGPHVFRDEKGCRKALAQKRHAEALEAACGPLPGDFVEWTSDIARAGVGRESWRYVDY